MSGVNYYNSLLIPVKT